MGMNMSSGSSAEPEPMMEMNMTPLIDVMLVLIIMLIITIPPENNSVNLNMPTPSNAPPPDIKPTINTIDVDFDGTISWNGALVNRSELELNLVSSANANPQPEIHLRPNKLVEYNTVASVMATAQRVGVKKLGIVGNEQFLK